MQFNRFRLNALAAVAALVMAAPSAWAVDPFTVRDIRIEGLQRVEPGTVFVSMPVRVGDTIHAEIEVTSVRPTSKGNRGIVASKIDIKNQKGEVVITYDATRMLAGKSK